MYFLRLRQAAASCKKPLAYIHLSTYEKRRYVMTSGLRQCIAEYNVANSLRYPIRRHVAFASTLEILLNLLNEQGKGINVSFFATSKKYLKKKHNKQKKTHKNNNNNNM